jgi:hypothetical protein
MTAGRDIRQRMSDPIVIEGGCLCGTVRFGLTALPRVANYCHCTRCQRRTGTGSSVSAAIDPATFRLLSGEEAIGGWQPPDAGNEKCFCTRCGAHLYARSPDGTRMGIRLGALDRDPGVRPSYRQYVAYATAWEPIPDDGLPRFSESRPPVQ